MLRKIIWYFLLFYVYNTCYSTGCDKPIIVLVATPRTLSTVFLRMMQARGDCRVFQEPLCSNFAAMNTPEINNWYVIKKTYQELYNEIDHVSKHTTVFIKEMCFAVVPFLKQYPEFISDTRVRWVFLVRNPHHAIISYARKLGAHIFEDFSNLVGYKIMYELYNTIKGQSAQAPLIIFSEDIYTAPLQTIQNYCFNVGISFIPESMEWSALGDQFDGFNEWSESKLPSITHHWHGDAIQSTNFHQPTHYRVDKDGQPTFEEIIDIHDRHRCIAAYKENKLFYDLLCTEHTINKC